MTAVATLKSIIKLTEWVKEDAEMMRKIGKTIEPCMKHFLSIDQPQAFECREDGLILMNMLLYYGYRVTSTVNNGTPDDEDNMKNRQGHYKISKGMWELFPQLVWTCAPPSAMMTEENEDNESE